MKRCIGFIRVVLRHVDGLPVGFFCAMIDCLVLVSFRQIDLVKSFQQLTHFNRHTSLYVLRNGLSQYDYFEAANQDHHY